MVIITAFCWEDEYASERRTGLQQNCVTAIGGIQRVLQTASGVDGDNVAGSWRVRHGALNVNSGQLCRPVESRCWGRYNRVAHSYGYGC